MFISSRLSMWRSFRYISLIGLWGNHMISLIQCKKDYKGNGFVTEALKETSIQFHKGKITAITGPSGSGKSTLLSLIGAMDKPTAGKIIVDDIDILQLSENRLADFRFEKIGFIFQHFELIPTLTALENVLAPLFVRKVAYNKVERAEMLLEKVGLFEKRNELPSQLSGGEKQRVAIARALVNEPQWILADEPTGNLDSKNGQMIYQLIDHLSKETNCGVLLVTHDTQLAAQADRIIEMKDGIIINDRGV